MRALVVRPVLIVTFAVGTAGSMLTYELWGLVVVVAMHVAWTCSSPPEPSRSVT